MKPMFATLALALSLAGPIAAEEGSWTGQLAVAACKAQDSQAACPIDKSTSTFGITVHGQFVTFDAAGNTEAAKAAENGLSGNPTVTVAGDYDGRTIKVQKLTATT